MKALNLSVLLLLCTLTPVAHAGPFADDLSRCLVQASTDADKLTLVKWMFASMALHPAVGDLATVPDAARDGANRDMAELLTDLLQVRCLDQARAAIENEGALALQASFAILGQVAANDLFSNPNVAAGLSGLDQFLDSENLDRNLGIGGN